MLVVASIAVLVLIAFVLGVATRVGLPWLFAMGASLWATYFIAVSGGGAWTRYGIVLGGLPFAGWALGTAAGYGTRRRRSSTVAG